MGLNHNEGGKRRQDHSFQKKVITGMSGVGKLFED